LEQLLQALHDWPVAIAFRQSYVAYPAVSALHILGLGVLVGSIIPLDLRMLGLFRKVPLQPLARYLSAASGIGLALAIVTGFFLFSVKPEEYIRSTPFLIKVGALALGVVNIALLRTGSAWRGVVERGMVSARAFGHALVSMLCWLTAIFAGRWIAFILD
jgi:hypothetical protein